MFEGLACAASLCQYFCNQPLIVCFSELQRKNELEWHFAQKQRTAGAVQQHTDRLIQEWKAPSSPPSFSTKVWRPKNHEVECPDLSLEFPLPWTTWKSINFPSFPVPEKISTHVNTSYWWEEMSRTPSRDGSRAATLMQKVFLQLTEGADSMVGPPGTNTTVSTNWFPCPRTDLPRMMDSLATEIKMEHMAGPLHPESVPVANINGFMAVPKPSGDRRQVCSFSINVQQYVIEKHHRWETSQPRQEPHLMRVFQTSS